jgi:hypothetical protein
MLPIVERRLKVHKRLMVLHLVSWWLPFHVSHPDHFGGVVKLIEAVYFPILKMKDVDFGCFHFSTIMLAGPCARSSHHNTVSLLDEFIRGVVDHFPIVIQS